jgi:polar amino acid transport system substrate-binding protein
MKTRIRILMVLALLMAYPLVAVAEESTLQQVLKRGELIVGTRSTNLPFCYKDEKGELTGFDIDLARELAFGLFNDRSKVKFTVFSSGGDRIPALQGRRVDCVISQFTVLEKRAQMIEFSVPYIKSGLAVLVKNDSAYTKNSDLNGKTIATRNDPTIKEIVLRAIPSAKVELYPETADALMAFRQGRSEGFVIDKPALAYIAKKYGGYRIIDESLSFEMLAIGSPQGDQVWLNYINSSLQQMSWDGRIQAIYKEWFGDLKFAPQWLRSEP